MSKYTFLNIMLAILCIDCMYGQGSLPPDSLDFNKMNEVIQRFNILYSSTDQQLNEIKQEYFILLKLGDSLYDNNIIDSARSVYLKANELYQLDCNRLNKISTGMCCKTISFDKSLKDMNLTLNNNFNQYLYLIEAFVDKFYWNIEYQDEVKYQIRETISIIEKLKTEANKK